MLKFIIVGDSNVGKSCLLLSYCDRKFKEDHDTTIGVEFGTHYFKYKDLVIKIQIWDTVTKLVVFKRRRDKSLSGPSHVPTTRGRCSHDNNFIRSNGVVLAFDLTSKDSFGSIARWEQEIKDATNDKIQMILVGNKLDLEHE